MKNTGKVGNKPGQPKFRTGSDFRARKDLQVNNFKVQNNKNNVRPMKTFNRSK